MSISKTNVNPVGQLINRPEAPIQPVDCQRDRGVKCYNISSEDAFEGGLAPQMNFSEFVTGGGPRSFAVRVGMTPGTAHAPTVTYNAPKPPPPSKPAARPGPTLTP